MKLMRTDRALGRLAIPKLVRIKLAKLAKPAKMRPPMRFEDVDDPLTEDQVDDAKGVLKGDAGAQATVAMSATLAALKKRREDENASRALTTDGAFYCNLIFDTREQKVAFLTAFEQRFSCRFEGDIFIDGRIMADALGIAIPEVKAKMPGLFRIDQKYAAMTMGEDD